jgi:phytoene dehydrogenase-like protein
MCASAHLLEQMMRERVVIALGRRDVRPAPELSRYGTPLRGLYVAGASTHPGGAAHGMSGRGAARRLRRV